VARANDIFAGRDERLCADLVAATDLIAGLIVSCRDGRRIWGQSTITVALDDDLALQLDADLFSQVNPAGNRHMIEELLRAGNFQPNDRVLELYCGAGNFTLPIARRVKEIVAVEGFRPAITNGALNAQRYHLENISWQSAAVPQAVGQLKRQHKQFSKIVLDPPRVGAKGIDADLAALGAEWIAYVSCDPTTLARDLAALTKHGYKLRTVQPIDFFPHSFHVESLAVMTREG
jgi:23S rRNA (uracil1939-C5)-methyltransferase